MSLLQQLLLRASGDCLVPSLCLLHVCYALLVMCYSCLQCIRKYPNRTFMKCTRTLLQLCMLTACHVFLVYDMLLMFAICCSLLIKCWLCLLYVAHICSMSLKFAMCCSLLVMCCSCFATYVAQYLSCVAHICCMLLSAFYACVVHVSPTLLTSCYVLLMLA